MRDERTKQKEREHVNKQLKQHTTKQHETKTEKGKHEKSGKQLKERRER